jgi:uncharacterized protein YecE (DUF72 family)
MSIFPVRIGTAGWNVPSLYSEAVPHAGSHLERYAQVLNAVEINSSFYRKHQRKSYQRWARSAPSDFLFSVKIPKAITHDARLANCEPLLDSFVEEVTGLGDKLGVLLVQLPPSFSFEKHLIDLFFRALRMRITKAVVLEPRHPSWFKPDVSTLLADLQIARVAADPALVAEARKAGGWDGLAYYRWHGSPRIYFSDYDAAALSSLKNEIEERRRSNMPTWCIFDNTALGAAFSNALNLGSLLGKQ